jgi:hypothetical protein
MALGFLRQPNLRKKQKSNAAIFFVGGFKDAKNTVKFGCSRRIYCLSSY